jgi:hypothetical protein
MQFVNDDMDQLFRDAAKDYPLKTDSGDWNAVLNKMQGENNTAGKKRKGRNYLLMLLLIPLLIICTTYIKNNPGVANSEKNEVSTDNYSSSKNFEKNGDVVKRNSSNQNAVFSNDQELKRTDEISFSSEAEKKISLPGNSRVIAKNNSGERYRSGADLDLSSNSPTLDNKLTNQVPSNTVNPANENSVVNSNNGQDNKTNTTKQEEKNSSNESNITTTASTEVQTPLQKPRDTSVPGSSNKKQKQPKSKANNFYFGFQLGPDFSMVKSTKIDGTGYSAGLLAGYNFNKKFAIETGLLWDHKRYQFEGRHFNTEKLNWPHVYLLDVSGFCNMFEIPLNLRYNISQNTSRTLFATAGVSSYLMKKENYDYSYVRYGAYGYGNREYKNTINNWLSVAHVSVGIQKKLGTIGDLRVEPYIKLPLHGVGIGSMPLRSAGIYLGVTRPIR